VILLPEGVIEFIPEFERLMKELNELMANGVPNTESVSGQRSDEADYDLVPHTGQLPLVRPWKCRDP
jgi:hypothetical protein